MNGQRVYLDYNASAPLLPAARTAMLSALENHANPSSVHVEGRAARRTVETARAQVAALVGAEAANVVFTSGASEAASMLLTPHWRMGRSPLRVARFYVSASDHPCLLNGGGFDRDAMTIVGVGADGVLDLGALDRALAAHDHGEGLPLVAVHAANNESGVIQPVSDIAAIVRARRGLLAIDAVQAAGRVPVDISGDYGDFLILSSHKIGGPKGAGALVGKATLTMPRALVSGGGQEKGHRAGTENVAAIAGFGAAAGEAAGGLAGTDRIRSMRDAAEAAILGLAANATIIGRDAVRLCNTVLFSIPGMKAETAQIAFDLAGVSLSSGSACSSGKVGPSHVLRAMGIGGDEGALRVSVGPGTALRDIDAFRAALEAHLARRGTATSAAA